MEDTNQTKSVYQSRLFSERIAKTYRHIKTAARKQKIGCYRVYDKDIPEVPLAVDIYEFLPAELSSRLLSSEPEKNPKAEILSFLAEENSLIAANDSNAADARQKRIRAVIYLYERPYQKTQAEEKTWLTLMAKTLSDTLKIPPAHVTLKIRKKQRGKNQYTKFPSSDSDPFPFSEKHRTIQGVVSEYGELFCVNLTDYIDTGLFFDRRLLRKKIRTESAGKTLLNLFCYTGSFSVYAASGNASKIESVDLSRTALTKAALNMKINGFTDPKKYIFTRADVKTFLSRKLSLLNTQTLTPAPQNPSPARYDIIILDPPVFSNSSSTPSILDIRRDFLTLTSNCLNLLNPDGTLYASITSPKNLPDTLLPFTKTAANLKVSLQDITPQTTPLDTKKTKAPRCLMYKVSRP